MEFDYRCNGKHGARQLDGPDARRCASKDINGLYLEDLIWRDLENFLRDPGKVLNIVASRLSAQQPDARNLNERCEQVKHLLSDKQQERERILSLYRRGRIDEASLETQLDEIQAEEEVLKRQQEHVTYALDNAPDIAAVLTNAGQLLERLRGRLDQELSLRNRSGNSSKRWLAE